MVVPGMHIYLSVFVTHVQVEEGYGRRAQGQAAAAAG